MPKIIIFMAQSYFSLPLEECDGDCLMAVAKSAPEAHELLSYWKARTFPLF